MLKIFVFLLFWGANFTWLLLVVGGLIAWLMPRTDNRNKIILTVSGVLSLLLTLAVIERGPDHDDGVSSCQSSRMSDSCY